METRVPRMASFTTADRTAMSSGGGGIPMTRCAQDVATAGYWPASRAAAPTLARTPPRQSPVAVTPSSTGNVSMASASDGSHTHRVNGMVRGRQQLTPRQLEFTVDDEQADEKQAPQPSTPPRVATASAPAVPVTPAHMTQYYAVARGRRVGVYTSIAEVYEETQGYDYHVYRLCASRHEAERFIDEYFDITHGKRSDPDPRHQSTLVAFCDGATQGKRNWSHQTGVACVFPHNSTWDIVYTCLDAYCTAYRATAKAALAAVKRANVENPARDQVLYIYTRNQLLVRAMTEWVGKWRQNDWRKGDGDPVKNRDVLQSFVDTQGPRRVIWRLADQWASEWTASVVSAAEDASLDVGELMDSYCI